MSWLHKNPRWNNRLQCYVNRRGDPIIYVDGSCKYNGYSNAISGIGIWVHEQNRYCGGSQYPDTSQFAELEAIRAGVKIAKDKGWNFFGSGRVEIRTDSDYAIKAATKFVHYWRENADEYGNWYNSKGYPVQHQGVIEEIWELASDFEQVNLAKVPAHADEIGNEGADRLAKLHIRRNDY